MDVVSFVEQSKLTLEQRHALTSKIEELKIMNRKLQEWLKSKELEKYIFGFHRLGYISVESIQKKMQRFEIKDVISTMDGSFSDYQRLVEAVRELKVGPKTSIIVSALYFFIEAFTFLFKWLSKYRMLCFCL